MFFENYQLTKKYGYHFTTMMPEVIVFWIMSIQLFLFSFLFIVPTLIHIINTITGFCLLPSIDFSYQYDAF